ncbi:DinB family protein [Trebonia sp.]|uniref:DinB family protein n=1 Tax=Trebonia sp. TaxID=2767075 RepID=UPI00262F186C|nr:DinB family protein [Trebonia sp.]
MRQDPDPTAGERDALAQYLDYQRATILLKAEGLSKDQLARQIPTSDLTLAGILYHLALVEESWMEIRFLGLPAQDDWKHVDWDADRDWEFHTATTMDPDDLRTRYEAACDRSRQAAARAETLDQLSAFKGEDGWQFTLRWVLLHLIEETARHAGHADLLREAIDGAVGE